MEKKMNPIESGTSILKEIFNSFSMIDGAEITKLIEKIKQSQRIFFVGAGRSRIMLSAFCMRLNHLGIESYMAGNIPCPPAKKGDLVIAASGSCETPSVIAILKRLKKLDIDIFLFTANPKININNIANSILKIQAPYRFNENKNNSTQLMRTLFEQVVFFVSETVIKELSSTIPVKEIIARHTNLE
ncbi:MAG: SIS domain-containing protein [Treponema sp.]|jgi:6-phospho-3-hexuloisomerase|nr:SIS domain-containing protein [Treponema sp.]